MCGIIGIVGKEAVSDRLVDGLKRMEYRGYDSAGVCTVHDGQLVRRRAEGKLANLVQVLKSDDAPGNIGIAHTRWATHGAPTTSNAHPHATQEVALVHNGIIENFKQLRDELIARGRTFESETDTEVVAHLVSQQVEAGHSPADAVKAVLPRLRGAFALAIAGAERVNGSQFGIVPTVAWQQRAEKPFFALEGGVYNAASAVNWARQIGLFTDYAEIGAFAREPAILRELAFVPALSGLACPHWDRSASGLWIGLGLDTTRADMMQSLIEGVALRAAEVIAAMGALLPLGAAVSVDGGMARNTYLLQVLADVTGRTITVPSATDLTALGTARMAMRGLGTARLPDMPPPASSVRPVGTYGPEARSRFATAVTRARGWKEA